MQHPELVADCSRCAGLCCVGLAFDRSPHFGFDKPAGVPCTHLTCADRCGIHQRLEEHGFGGCARYDCLGAGQRVMREVFPGRHWREGASDAERLFDAFHVLRRVHEALQLLTSAARLPLSRAERASCTRLTRRLAPDTPWTEQTLTALEASSVFRDVRDFLASLKGSVRRSALRTRLPIVDFTVDRGDKRQTESRLRGRRYPR